MLTDLQNPHQLSPAALTSLAAVLQAAEALAADLPAPLLRYLVDGVGEDTIATDLLWGIQQYCTQHHPHLLTDPNMGRRLGLIALPAAFALDHTASDRPLLAWISAYPVADPAFYTRLVRLVSCFYETQVDASGQIQLGILSDRFNRLLQGALPTYYFTQGEAPPPAAQCLSTAIVAGVYCAEGHPAAAFARDVYDVGPQDYWRQALAKHAVYLTGFADYSLQHAAIVQAVLHHEERDRRLHALTLLAQGQVPITPWLGAIVQAAVASAKSEREAALPLIKQNLAIALPALQAKATSGSASDRLYAAKLLWELQGEAAQPFLTDRLAVEKNAKTKATLEALLATATAAPPPPLALPPLPPVDPTPPLPSDLTATLERLADLLYQGRLHWGYWLFEALKHNHQAGKSLDDQFRCFGLALADKAAIIDLITATLATPPLDATEAVKQVIALLDARSQTPELAAPDLCTRLQQGTYAECARDVRWGAQMYANQIKKEAKTLLTRPDFHLIHAVRLLALLGYMPVQSIQYQAALVFSPEGHELLAVYRQHHPDGGGLREFAAVLEALGVNPDLIATEMLNYWGTSGFWRWGTDAIWPYYAERSPLLEQILTQPTQEYGDQWRRKHAFRAIQTWPQPPAPLIPLLWKLALEGSKAERGIAQGCLNALPETPERILATLSHPDRELRTIAASWLGDRGDPAAIPPLQQALKKEKSDAAKDIMLRSLEKLGATVDDLLNRDRLLQECQTLLKKGFPAALDWFPWAALPTVHWHDTGEMVDPAIVQGLIVQCFKQKTPEPGPILKRYVALWSPAEREAVG
ncbi:MAG TPA: HEAT repeat domain-containing protein, partial [Candidatus Obscuribacterales bacterium]